MPTINILGPFATRRGKKVVLPEIVHDVPVFSVAKYHEMEEIMLLEDFIIIVLLM